jgi:hypothetical protein
VAAADQSIHKLKQPGEPAAVVQVQNIHLQ